MDSTPLHGTRVVSLAVNLPGPLACARLRDLGAEVTKVEPPAGDPLAAYVRPWYEELARGQRIVGLDLKSEAGSAALADLLAAADLLVTSSRLSALERLGLGWDVLHARHPRLCHVAIVGEAGRDRPGHDLTYAAEAGLVTPPDLPPSLFVDLAGAERAVSTSLALLMARQRDGVGRFAEVALCSMAEELAAPPRYGLTRPGGLLGGGAAAYGLYRAKEGWIAVAALEPAFARHLADEIGADVADRAALEAAFLARTAAEWQAWARERDLPVSAVASVSAAP
jgi:crotonobetainyl-CoA:carnitine CoA-transferase CaiB-like acyl-CoA transferase